MLGGQRFPDFICISTFASNVPKILNVSLGSIIVEE
jgi:hypothetical protein